ncbi:hypothetical protein QBC39DRAFT_364264 [Podospora conica]|nr:hypothetical protein QBC39DRAFT_364264 [Schizothecium conicum]
MANDTMLTDDYVASLLSKEANDASIKYSSMGLEAFRSAKPANKAKPNTRFLGRIIKETTNHNAALLAKEAAEAQARLDNLTVAEEKKRRKLNPTSGDIRRHQLGAISSILAGRKRKHGDAGEKDKNTPGERDGVQRGSARQSGSKEDKNKTEEPRDRRREEARSRDDRRHRDRSRSPTHQTQRHRQRTPLSSDDEEERRSKSRRKGKERAASAADAIIGSLEERKRRGRLDPPERSRHNKDLIQPSKSSRSRSGRLAEGDDSDPLDDLIGPAPPPRSPVRPRGRGAARGPSAMDSRFSESYDPQSDAQPEAEEAGDWEESVEVFRDRQKWKQQGADRLRAAGFTDDQIKKWEKGGEPDIDDVKWTKPGEGREWDRGKDR